MKRALVLPMILLVLAVCANADIVGTIVVSGDSNIGNGIDGSAGATIADNGLFFRNLLGAGTTVAIRTTTNPDTLTEISSQNAIIGYYTGLGKTVNQFSTVTAPGLAGASLFIGFLPDVDFTAAETTLIANYLAAGGSVLLTGEWGSFDTLADNHINALLTALGSTLRISPADLDLGVHVATGSQIAADALTVGIREFSYAATSDVAGGTALFYTTAGTPFMEYTSAVPEPSAIVLLLTAGLGAFAVRRRRA